MKLHGFKEKQRVHVGIWRWRGGGMRDEDLLFVAPVGRTRTSGQVSRSRLDARKNLLMRRTVLHWNYLPPTVVSSP